jgi:hypothetical protein
VEQHVSLVDFHAGSAPCEAEIVNYADKRVMHDKVVSLEVRLADLMKRYNGSNALGSRFSRMHRQALAIETKLFACLSLPGLQIDAQLAPDGLKKKLTRFQQVNQGRCEP